MSLGHAYMSLSSSDASRPALVMTIVGVRKIAEGLNTIQAWNVYTALRFDYFDEDELKVQNDYLTEHDMNVNMLRDDLSAEEITELNKQYEISLMTDVVHYEPDKPQPYESEHLFYKPPQPPTPLPAPARAARKHHQ